MTLSTYNCQCCIAGGGPAGLMLGYLLARAGVDVIVLEKHADFLRDFRGDTIHPSTLEVMHELGLLDRFLQLPHQRTSTFTVTIGAKRVQMADLSTLPVKCPFMAMMPQWDFLNFLAKEGAKYPGFKVLMPAVAQDLLSDGERSVGVRGDQAGTPFQVRANLVVGADGRTSVMRDKAGLKVKDLGAPIDALWFKLPKEEQDGEDIGGLIQPGRIVVRLNRTDYWQCAFVIPKGAFDDLKRDGLKAFHRSVADVMSFDVGRVAGALSSWDDVKLLRVTVNRLDQWYREGFLAIGDAAHAMSPVGGVGVNLAIQDAVAAANILHQSLRDNEGVPERALARVQKRRLWATRIIQYAQVQAQNNLIKATLDAKASTEPFMPAPIRIMQRFPFLQRLPARVIGLGVRMEHVAHEIRFPS